MQEINYIVKRVKISDIKVDKIRFDNLCKTGCRVYGTKWSCPPSSTPFNNSLVGDAILVIFWMKNTIKSKNEYIKVKAINSILKSKLYQLLKQYDSEMVLGSGSCRMCQRCSYPNPCKHPEEMIYSMESRGIDVQHLCRTVAYDLHWYLKGTKTPYLYGTVVGLVLDFDNEEEVENKIKYILYGINITVGQKSLFDFGD